MTDHRPLRLLFLAGSAVVVAMTLTFAAVRQPAQAGGLGVSSAKLTVYVVGNPP